MALELNSLVNNLAGHLKATQHLLTILQSEQQAIVNNQHSALESLIDKKSQIIKIIEQLDATKKEILFNFSKELKLSKTPKGVESILPYLPANYQKTLKAYIDAIKKVATKLKAINTNNAKLLDFSVSFIGQMIKTVAPSEMNNTYTSDGAYKGNMVKSSFEYCR